MDDRVRARACNPDIIAVVATGPAAGAIVQSFGSRIGAGWASAVARAIDAAKPNATSVSARRSIYGTRIACVRRRVCNAR